MTTSNSKKEASKLKLCWQTLTDTWKNRAQLGEQKRNQQELDFLPAALEILERPPSPVGKLLARVIIAFVTIGIIWACVGDIEITALAEGKIISSSRIKNIQPLEKGVLKTIYVKEGQKVEAGEPLIELDQTLTAAEQTRIAQEMHFAQLNWLREKTFLTALQQNKTPLLTPTPVTAVSSYYINKSFAFTPAEQFTQTLMLEQKWLDYQSRVNTIQSQKKERQAEYNANEAKLNQLQQTLPIATSRVVSYKKLFDDNLIPEMNYLEAKEIQIEQQQTLYSYQAQQQQNIAAIETAEQQLNTLKSQTISQALTQVDEFQRQVQSLTQELAKAKDVSDKQILYAPVAGKVQQLAVHTVGGVVTEAQILMQLVPHNDYLEVEAVLENKDIGFVYAGQIAEIKVNTFNFTKYGSIDAEVIDVTADAIADENKGLVYKLRLKMKQKSMTINGREVDLLPGMSVMAEVKTSKRKLIEFVLSPLMRKVDESVGER
ncbi:HlyD family type I secretion periplasmic adaptor subunit [Colwellia sp. E2M01]|uniref:HlyD family type I secretion periplasmic adaptor subunit n=1 Tax=Colwellia sp. E2M01 TaxID=2841561 RepID=UPI001C08511B|nr:HlyD family type I secretion periplasmic adaptor subunit [Colwellia sp. E2M01]MBU2870401.1 HlyD family type I secretion periplasmic adaptor subunit [Colwellia sp. E2M01]